MSQEDSAFEGYDLKRVQTELGPHKRETLLKASRLVLSPGVPLTQPDIAAAIQAVSKIILNMTRYFEQLVCSHSCVYIQGCTRLGEHLNSNSLDRWILLKFLCYHDHCVSETKCCMEHAGGARLFRTGICSGCSARECKSCGGDRNEWQVHSHHVHWPGC